MKKLKKQKSTTKPATKPTVKPKQVEEDWADFIVRRLNERNNIQKPK